MIEKIIKGLKPLSNNRAWQGRRFKTKEHGQFSEAMHHLLGKKSYMPGDVEITLKFGLIKKSFKRSDVDNLCKATLDSIVNAGMIDDDCHVRKITLEKYLSDDYEIDIAIKSYQLYKLKQ